ncbi:MAG: DUF4105 domain-containing protein [Prevotella sp.]|nr:DUF4105 domain-containing protein [Prevotella sp.]
MAQEDGNDSVANDGGGLATDVFASLIIAEPSNDFYGCCGHCAIRMQCPSHDMDYCFTYSFSKTFANKFRFFDGTGEGTFVPMYTEDFLEEYKETHRGVIEYKLNLTLEEKRLLWQSLDENAHGSSHWKYDFLKTNCSAMCAYFVEQSLIGERIVYGELAPVLTGDNRTFVKCIFAEHPWFQFFWLTIFGAQGEEVSEVYTRLAPSIITEVWGDAILVNDSTGNVRPIFDGAPVRISNEHTEITSAPVTPFVTFLALLMASLVITAMHIKGVARKVSIYFDITLLAVQTIVSIISLYFNTLSQFQCVHDSWHVLMMNPLPLLVVLLFRRKSKNMRIGFMLYSALIVVYLCVAPFSPQILLPHVFIALALLLRSGARSLENLSLYHKGETKNTQTLHRRRIVRGLLLIFLPLIPFNANAQRYFVDGYHGGVYGHYPMMTYTQFMYDQLKQHPAWSIGLEIEPETWDTVRVRTPEAYHLFKSIVGSSQVEYTNPSYAQSYFYCVEGESIIRQFQLGMAKIREHFPDVRIQTYACEEPCYTSCLPTLLPQLGFKYMTLKCPNTCWGGYARNFGGQFVNLIGPDGTGMTVVPRYACETLEPNSVWQTTGWGNGERYWNACSQAGVKNPVAMTYQDAGWTKGPWIGYGEKQKGTQYILWSDYFDSFAASACKPDYRMSQEDVCPGLMWGSQVMQKLAQTVRKAENYLVDAEKCMVIENLSLPGAFPQLSNGESLKNMNEAWRTLLLSEHHDCWIVPYNNLNKYGTWADNVNLWTASSIRIAKDEVEKAVVMENGCRTGWLVMNTLPYSHRQVFNENDKVFAVDLPPFGTTKIADEDVICAKDTYGIKVNKDICTVENNMFRIQFNLKKGGTVSSLIVKDGQIEYVNNNGGYYLGELRGFFKADDSFRSSTENPASVEVLYDNSLMKSLRLNGEIARVPFSKTITLTEGDPKIKVTLTLDWKHNEAIGDNAFKNVKKIKGDNGPQHVSYYDTRYMLSVFFPTSIGSGNIIKDAPYDVCESRLDNTFYNRWDSIKHNVVLNWIDLEGTGGKSMALFTDHTTSYSYGKDYPLALTVQYSGPGLWGRNYTVNEPTTMTYHVMPHEGTWNKAHIQLHNDMLNTPQRAMRIAMNNTERHSFLSLEDTGYSLSAFINEGDKKLTLRLFNSEGDSSTQSIILPSNVVRMQHVDLLGNVLDEMPINSKNGVVIARVSMPRFAVNTYRLYTK